MEFDRINPVALIAGATSGAGAACALDMARRADGGLILVAPDATALDALADKLGEQGASPERVSMLAFDIADEEAWTRAHAFIKAQYGRLDWALVNTDAPPAAEQSDLVQWPSPMSGLEGAALALRALMPLMKLNSQGGAIVVSASGPVLKADGKPGLLQMVRAAAKEGAADTIRVNAVATASAEAAAKASAPAFDDLVQETGGQRAAWERISALGAPLVRFGTGENITRAIMVLLADETPVTGTTLVVDAGHAL